MKIKCLHSGSDGNCYLLQTDKETLILECGISMKDIKIGLNFNLMNVVGVVVSHIHSDHSKSLDDFKRIGIPVFAPYEQAIRQPKKHHYGSFYVTALPMLDKNMEHWQHTNGDGSECPCYAFLVEADNQKLFYVTDTKLCVWNLHKVGINHLLIGLNYMPDMVADAGFKKYHVLTGHMGLDACKGIVKSNQTEHLQNVILCHLSGDTTNREQCVTEVQSVVGNGIYVGCARKGFSWELRADDECPF